jgi:CubicO group peptidase (beta-lactamase class C family)
MRMRSVVGLVLVAVLGWAGVAAAQQAGDVAERVRRVEAGLLTPVVIAGQQSGMLLEERLQHYRVPGLSIAVINDGRIEWAKGYGVVEAGGSSAVDTATLFQAASISKPVAALGALRLVEAGRLALDADVNASLTSWQVEQNGHTQVERVTLRRLLSHSAGLTVHGFRGYAAGEAVPGLVQVLDGAAPANSARVRPDTTPGARWRYSGGGSSVVQLLMQDVTGLSFPDLMRELVLVPTGMVHSGYEQPLPAARAAAAAVGHRGTGQPVAGRWHTYPEMFAAGLWTTPSDLARLAVAVQRSYAGASDGVVTAGMTREMLTAQAGEYGLGFAVARGPDWTAFSHGGANEGFRATFFAFADRGQGVIVMTNSDNGGPLISEVIRAVAQEYDWPAQRAVVRAVVPIAPARLAAMAGVWTGELNGRVVSLTVSAAGATLQATGWPLDGRTLHHFGDDAFFHVEGTTVLRFESDGHDRFTGAVLEGAGQPVRLSRAAEDGMRAVHGRAVTGITRLSAGG